MVHKSRYVTCWWARVVFDPSARHLCGWLVMAFDSASEQEDDSVSCCSGDPWLSFQHRAVSESRAMQPKPVMWKSWEFLPQFVQVIIWLLVEWQWGVAELAFARSRIGRLIEAVSRSAEERRSNQVIILWEISITIKCFMCRTSLKCYFKIWTFLCNLKTGTAILLGNKSCASVKLIFST